MFQDIYASGDEIFNNNDRIYDSKHNADKVYDGKTFLEEEKLLHKNNFFNADGNTKNSQAFIKSEHNSCKLEQTLSNDFTSKCVSCENPSNDTKTLALIHPSKLMPKDKENVFTSPNKFTMENTSKVESTLTTAKFTRKSNSNPSESYELSPTNNTITSDTKCVVTESTKKNVLGRQSSGTKSDKENVLDKKFLRRKDSSVLGNFF